MQCRFKVLLLLSFCLPLMGTAQYYSSGEDPASIRWQQIKTTHFTIVFPSEMEEDARRMAVILDEVRGVNRYSSNHQPKHFDVLMHGHSAYSNGFVAWTPRRMELYPTGGTSLYPQAWLEQLGVHEYRHIIQMDRMNRGFTRCLYYAFGQQAVAAMVGLHIPMWYMEGDATLTETLLTETGRGRMPWFEQLMRAQVLDKGIYSYDKATFGSYRDFVPNRYAMGYHLVAGVSRQYGQQAWINTFDGVARNSWWPFSFSYQLKQHTGHNKTSLYLSVFDSIANRWKQIDDSIRVSPSVAITPERKLYQSYLYPHVTTHDTVIAELSGPSDEGSFVTIAPNGTITTLYIPGIRNDEPFSLQGNRMAWSEYRMDLRWGNAQHSVIRLMDITSGKVRTVSPPRGKYFAPALHPVNNNVAMVSVNDSNRCTIEIRSLNDHTCKATFATERDMVTSLQWTPDGEKLAAIVLTPEGKKLALLDVSTGHWQDLLPPSRNDIRNVCVDDHRIYYSAAQQGMENIFSVSLTDASSIIQHTSARLGATAPFVCNGQLYYSQYTANGYQVARCDADQDVAPPSAASQSIELYKGMEPKEELKARFDYSTKDTYPVTHYSKWHLLNVHSWAPALIDVDSKSVSRGITLMSQNTLNTLTIEAGYNGDPNYTNEKYNLTLNWKGWFPVLSLDLKAGDSSVNMNGYYTYSNSTDIYYLKANASSNIYQLKPGISLPLDISRGAFYRKLIPSVKYTFYHQTGYDYQQTAGSFVNNRFVPGGLTSVVTIPTNVFKGIELDLFYYNLRKGSTRDVATRHGQVIELNYRTNTGSSVDRGSLTALFTRMYLPGLGRHHAIKIENNFQQKRDGENQTTSNDYLIPYTYSSTVHLPRGFGLSDAQRIYSFRSDYMLPLVCPDVALGGLAYIKRIKASLFYDFSATEKKLVSATTGAATLFRNQYYSLGYELRSDMHVCRFIYPIELGYRQVWLPQQGTFVGEMLLAITIN